MFPVLFDLQDYMQLVNHTNVLVKKFEIVIEFVQEDRNNLTNHFLIRIKTHIQNIFPRISALIQEAQCLKDENKIIFPSDIQAEGVKCFDKIDYIFSLVDEFVDEYNLNVDFKQFLDDHYSLGQIDQQQYLFF